MYDDREMTAKARQAARDPFLEQADPGGELRRTGAGGRSSVSRGGAKAVLYAPRLQVGRDPRPKEEKLTPPTGRSTSCLGIVQVSLVER
jgi:hypothetical protein